MSDRPRTACPTCGEAIEADETDVIEAVEVVLVGAFGAHTDTEDGLRVAFHESCFPEGDPGYRRV